MKQRSPLLRWVVVSFASATLLACDTPGDTASAPSASQSAATSEVDLASYCATMCERTTSCGVELAKREAGPADAEVIAQAKREAPALEKSCREGCGADAVDPARKFQMERAQVCLGRTDCDELAKCMAAL
jgi:hypothetical protein